MRKRTKLFYAKLLSLFAALLCALIFIYTYQLHKVIETNTLNIIRETAAHDRIAITRDIEGFLNELAGVKNRIFQYKSGNMTDLEARLHLENETTSFSELFLISEKGMVYTDKFVNYPLEKAEKRLHANLGVLLEPTRDNELVLWFQDLGHFAGIGKASVLYALKLENQNLGVVNMSWLGGVTSIEALQRRMILDGFYYNDTPQGSSSVINRNGDFILGKTPGTFIGEENNFFASIAASRGMEKAEIIEKMDRHETFSFYVDGFEGRKLIYMMPFSTTGRLKFDWYFVMTLNSVVLEEQQATFSIISLSLLGVVMTLLVLLMLYAMSAHNRLYQTTEGMKLREEFLSSMSHEIRTPLNGLLGMNYLISSHIDNPKNIGQIREWLRKSRRLGEYLLSMLNDILDMSKLRADKMDLVLAPMSIDQLIDDVMVMQSAVAEAKQIDLRVEKETPYPWVVGDQTRIKQILTNIMGNAAKFTPDKGSITLIVTQKPLDQDRVETTFICRDTGIGMSQAFLDTIFEPFAQEHRASSDTTLKGTGLGMPISRKLAEAMGGRIEVSSVLGEGSVFTVKLVCELADADVYTASLAREVTHKDEDIKHALPLSPDTTRKASEKPGGIKVLIAEDAEFNAEFLMEVLTDEGFDPVHAENGREAVDIFSASKPGEIPVILMDMQMPVMDGCQATEAIRKLRRSDARTVIIFACTANIFSQDRERAIKSGMDDFLTKPVDIKVFLQKIHTSVKQGLFQGHSPGAI